MEYIQILNDEVSRYCLEKDKTVKEQLYTQNIKPVFEQAAKHIIDIYGFGVPPENVDRFKQDCVEYLYKALGKYKPRDSLKHFSYFNVIIKCWMTGNRRHYNAVAAK